MAGHDEFDPSRGIDFLVHSMAFSREITKSIKDTSRKAYHEAMGISAYSLVSLVRAAEPYMANRPGGAITLAAVEIAEFTELGDYLSMPLRTYSTGMRVRLAMGVVTSIDPEILLLDEGIGAAARLARRRPRQ